MEKAIVLNDLTKRYKNNRGIANISLEVARGEVFGFLGPNGAGKTTVMKIMTGLMKPDSGNVLINGFSVLSQYEQAMESVGCIIEDVAPHAYLSAYDNMKLCARFYPGADDARIDECLSMTGMLKYKKERVRGFSLGMRQRLGISLAFLSNPSVMILDEPLNGLDVEGMVDIRNLILAAAEKGTTFFISSHLIHDVELTCSRVGLVYGGQLLSVATTEDILKNYSSLENYYLSEVGEVE